MIHQQKYTRVTNSRNRSVRLSQRGFTLLASVFLTLFLGTLIGAAFMSMGMQLKESDQRIASHDAFYTAEAGLEYAQFLLRQDSSWRPRPSLTGAVYRDPRDLTTAIGSYTIRVDPPGVPVARFRGWPFVWVRSDGVDAQTGIRRSILARVIIQSPTNFLAFTLGDLTIRSGANYDFDVLARDVNFRVDQSLPAGPARDIVVDGTVNYMRTISGETGAGVRIAGSRSSPSVTFTGVDLHYYQSNAAATMGGGSTTPSIINRSLSSNGLVYVDGDLHIKGTYEADMVFVAKGNIYIDGDITARAPVGGGQKPQLGLFSAKDVIIPASAPLNIDVEAFVLADGGVFKAEKSAISKNNLKFTGAIAVRGKENTLGIDLNAYASRQYIYNTAFNSSTIPFLPSIANIVTWQEINPNPGTDFPPP